MPPCSSSASSSGMINQPRRHITLELIRKRAEHNEGLVSNLEEVALHQEELEAIGPIIGRTCGKTLRILLLQNNVIDRMDPADLKHFKRLEYLNLAINNITLVEGIAHLEFLEKIDLTLNFIHYHTLRKSLEAMMPLRSLKELYLIGNPCYTEQQMTLNKQRGWYGYREYVIAKLSQLHSLDGKVITRSERLKAQRNLSSLEDELDRMSSKYYLSQDPFHTFQGHGNPTHDESKNVTTKHDAIEHSHTFIQDDEHTYNCPQDRLRISHEMAAQKAEKEKLEKTNQAQVKGEKEDLQEQMLVIERVRSKQEKGEIRQCNEGKWNFHFDEDLKPDFLSLIIPVPKHLSSALIDLDIHPTYITVVIKSKVLRLILPLEVQAEESSAQRSMASGKLVISMPKCLTKQGIVSHTKVHSKTVVVKDSRNVITKSNQRRSTLGTDMIAESLKPKGVNMEEYMNEVTSRRLYTTLSAEKDHLSSEDTTKEEDDDIPPLF